MSIHRSSSILVGLTALVAPAAAQWNSSPTLNTPVCVQPGDQAVPKAAATGDGGTWIGWFDHRGANYDVYVQLLDRDGNAAFAVDGLLVSSNAQSTSLVDWDLIADSSGGCVLAFTDTRAGGDLDVYAYRISPTGQFLWGANGVALSNNSDYEPNPSIAELSDGSFAFVWAQIPNSGTGSIRAQRLDVNGVPLYVGGDIALATGTATNEKPGFCKVVAAENGGYVVMWLRNIATFLSPRHIKAQKYDASGVAQWNGGAPTSVYDASAVPIAHQPILQSDGAGGAVFCWHNGATFFESYVQRVNASGVEQFAHNGIAVSLEANVGEFDPALAYLPASGDMIVVYDRRDAAQGARGIGVQRISAAGARLWGNDGVELEPIDSVTEGRQRIVPFGDGALVTYFQFPVFGGQGSNILARRIDGSGADVWNATVVAADGQVSRDKPLLVIDSVGTARAVWDDERADSGDIYAQDIHVDGALGPIATCTANNFCVSAVNSVGAGATIGWSGSTSLALNNFGLRASGCPSSINAIFFYGPTQIAPVPFHAGFLCTTGGFSRLPVLTTNGSGDLSYSVDLTTPPNVLGQINAGSTWHFQLWYRDPSGPNGSTNTSDALQATFCD